MSKLLDQGKAEYMVDMHIHTYHSADGTQSVEQAIKKSAELGFDIISITDHDSISAYEELESKNVWDEHYPALIPGVEFSALLPGCHGRCHILKYFFDSADTGFRGNLLQNLQAGWQRAEIQFRRIDSNLCLQYFFEKHGILCSLDGYKRYLLEQGSRVPEYPSLIDYIYALLSKKGVGVWDVYYKSLELSEHDLCAERRTLKKRSLERFFSKYEGVDIGTIGRKLLPLLAPVGIDDACFPGYKPSGSLSVHEYGQINVRQLDNSGINIFAHPNEQQLQKVDSLMPVVSGVEINYRSSEALNAYTRALLRTKTWLTTLGSDTHACDGMFYHNPSFYLMDRKTLIELFERAKGCT